MELEIDRFESEKPSLAVRKCLMVSLDVGCRDTLEYYLNTPVNTLEYYLNTPVNTLECYLNT